MERVELFCWGSSFTSPGGWLKGNHFSVFSRDFWESEALFRHLRWCLGCVGIFCKMSRSVPEAVDRDNKSSC